MAGRPTGAVLKHLQSLFARGSIGGLSDGQLLEQFATHRDEDAFAVLVERHGPMVVRLCRQVIGDEHEAQDAAQAAFLVLARRAGSIRRHDSVASWLYRVARRVAVRARAVAARRRETEWRGALMAAHFADDSGPSVPQTELYEELDRLAERYRAPLVLCYLEGLTHEQAAQTLRCPVRTVETRLMRGRARLRERLIRRGVVPSAVLVGATRSASAAMPAAWIEATVRAAIAFTGSRAAAVGMVSAQAVVLAEGVLNVMFIKKLGLVATSLLILGGLAAGGGVWARQDAARTSAEVAPPIVLGAEIPTDADTPEGGLLRADPLLLQAKTDRSDGEARELALDDGTMKGKKSIAGGGHAVRFEAPGEGWTLTAVRIHGSRYGYPRPPQEDFQVFLCDEKFQPIAEFAFPYSKFERGEAEWVTLEVKPTKLPRTFILGVNFNPTGTKGVYVSHDKEGSGRSFVGLPKQKPRPFKQGDWLIRSPSRARQGEGGWARVGAVQDGDERAKKRTGTRPACTLSEIDGSTLGRQFVSCFPRLVWRLVMPGPFLRVTWLTTSPFILSCKATGLIGGDGREPLGSAPAPVFLRVSASVLHGRRHSLPPSPGEGSRADHRATAEDQAGRFRHG